MFFVKYASRAFRPYLILFQVLVYAGPCSFSMTPSVSYKKTAREVDRRSRAYRPEPRGVWLLSHSLFSKLSFCGRRKSREKSLKQIRHGRYSPGTRRKKGWTGCSCNPFTLKAVGDSSGPTLGLHPVIGVQSPCRPPMSIMPYWRLLNE